jgi:hypothetical protein
MLSLRSLSFALLLTTLLACAARGQSGTATVTASGRVSGTVMLSIAPNAQLSDQETMVSYSNLNAYTILVSIKVSGSHGARRIAIPAQIRSNVGYTLSASAKSNGAALLSMRGLRVTDVRATGRFVAPDAVEAVNRGGVLEATLNTEGRAQKTSQRAPVFPSPATLLTGPRISLAGTSDSPHNALEVIIMAEVESPAEATHGSIELLLSAQPAGASLPALASR